MSALEDTRRWLERAVIGLNLCPFAKAVHSSGRVRWVASRARSVPTLAAQLLAEMQHLAATDALQTDTTLIVHAQVLHDFRDFNDFLGLADDLLQQAGLDGVLQVASFHPQYRFAGTRSSDIANATNRSPHPTLHLLREASVARAVAAFPDAAAIYGRNIATLRALGHGGWQAVRDGRAPPTPAAAAAAGPRSRASSRR